MKKAGKWIGIIITAVCIWLFFFADYSLVWPNFYICEPSDGAAIRISAFFQRVTNVFGEFSLVKEALFFVLVWFLFKASEWKKQVPRFIYVLSFSFSIVYLVGESFYRTDSTKWFLGDALMLLLFLIRVWGGAVIAFYAFFGAYLGLKKVSLPSTEFKKVTWPLMALCIGLFWIPQLLLIFPGGYPNDIQAQLMQFFGYTSWDNAHPPFVTMMVGACVWIGNQFKHPTLGLYLYTGIQFLYILGCVSYAMTYIANKVQKKPFTLVCILFPGLTCAFSYYASTIGKDAPYSASLLVAAVILWQAVERMRSENVEMKDIWNLSLRFSVFTLIASLIRHNGIWVTIPMAIVYCIVIARTKGEWKKKVLIGALSFAGAAFFFLISKVIYPAMGIENSMDHLIYTNMLQHSARYVTNYPGETSMEDLWVMEGVIDVTRIEEAYNPRTSDGIKNIVNLNASDEDVKEYYKVWAKQVRKHPGIILSAAFNVTYGFWTPVAENMENDFSDYYYNAPDYPELNFNIPSRLTGLRNIYGNVLNMCMRIPGIRLFQNPGIYYWGFLFTACFVSSLKKKKYLVAFMPGIVTSINYIGFPAYYHHPRYSFPLVFAMLMYVAIVIVSLREETHEEVPSEEN